MALPSPMLRITRGDRAQGTICRIQEGGTGAALATANTVKGISGTYVPAGVTIPQACWLHPAHMRLEYQGFEMRRIIQQRGFAPLRCAEEPG
ncbi:hypothetical protein PGQ11_006117 [Apiospora arundinis]|uniref:Uncharacterized protein n=1 Tax=Apiospora arundinis TaxID=335852 RepID=A0ABR2IRQ8_9PEZI